MSFNQGTQTEIFLQDPKTFLHAWCGAATFLLKLYFISQPDEGICFSRVASSRECLLTRAPTCLAVYQRLRDRVTTELRYQVIVQVELFKALRTFDESENTKIYRNSFLNCSQPVSKRSRSQLAV
jgi:hypothetical protein